MMLESQLLGVAQRLAFDALAAPIAEATRHASSSALTDVWRGKGEAEAELAAALAAFSASPQRYVTEVGDHLLGLPQQLEPYANGPTLTLLAAELRGEPSAPAEEDGALAWLAALGRRTVELLLHAVASIDALSPLGALPPANNARYEAHGWLGQAAWETRACKRGQGSQISGLAMAPWAWPWPCNHFLRHDASCLWHSVRETELISYKS